MRAMATRSEDVLPEVAEDVGIDWDAYATQYDLMAKYNPSYHENIKILRSYIGEWNMAPTASICDLGAGTGNYICALAKDAPQRKYVHVDFDKIMNGIAQAKYEEAGLNVAIVEEYIQRLEFPPKSFDLILCVNALYAIQPQEAVLHKVRKWLKPGGKFFVIDFGRRARIFDWGWYMLKSVVKEHGILECSRLLANSVEVVRQNRKGSKTQQQGRYWLHSTLEFNRILTNCGFRVEDIRLCYRDYCDLAVCSVETSPRML